MNPKKPSVPFTLAPQGAKRELLGKDEDIILGEHEIGGRKQESNIRSQQNRKSQGYCIDVTFSELSSDTTIDKCRSTSIKLEPPEGVKCRYINHVYKCLKENGMSNYLIADNLKISINTLKNNIKDR